MTIKPANPQSLRIRDALVEKWAAEVADHQAAALGARLRQGE